MLNAIELLAVIASGTFGVLLARERRMDFVGVFSVACMTAFGGGTLRDLFLDRHPLFWIENHHYPVIVFVLALATSLPRSLPRNFEKVLCVPDALALGFFSIVGVGHAMESGTSLFVASLLGVVTGTFGGVIGDVVCNEVPNLFRAAPLYATCSFLGCWLFLLVGMTPVPEALAVWTSVGLIVVLRLAALKWKICLPEHARSSKDSGDANDSKQSDK